MIIIKVFLSLLLSALAWIITWPLVKPVLNSLSGGAIFKCDWRIIDQTNCNQPVEDWYIRGAFLVFFILYYFLFSKLLGKFIK